MKRKGLTFFELLIVLSIVLFPVVLLVIAWISSLSKHFTKKSVWEKLAEGWKKLWDNRDYLIDQWQKYIESQKRNALAYWNDMRNDYKKFEKNSKKKSKKLLGLFG